MEGWKERTRSGGGTAHTTEARRYGVGQIRSQWQCHQRIECRHGSSSSSTRGEEVSRPGQVPNIAHRGLQRAAQQSKRLICERRSTLEPSRPTQPRPIWQTVCPARRVPKRLTSAEPVASIRSGSRLCTAATVWTSFTGPATGVQFA
jgi:hypothetical protein